MFCLIKAGEAKDGNQDPIYSKLKVKGQSSKSTNNGVTEDDGTEPNDFEDPLYATLKPKGHRSEGAGKSSAEGGTSQSKMLPDLEKMSPHQLAEVETELMLQNERLMKELSRVAMEMKKLKKLKMAQDKAVLRE